MTGRDRTPTARFEAMLRSIRDERAAVAWLAGGFLLFFSPLVLADVPFQDDVIRSLLGELFWSNVGRQGALWATRLLTVSNGVDPFPLTLFEAAIILAGTVFAVCRIARGRIDPTLAVATGAVFTSPFFLQNMSYHFDCLSMSVAASCAALAAAVALRRPRRTAWLRAALLVLMLFSYQAALGLYAGIALLLTADRLLRPDPATRLRFELARLGRAFLLPAVLCVAYALAFRFVTTGDASRSTVYLTAPGANIAWLCRVTRLLFGWSEWAIVAGVVLALVGVVVRRRASPAETIAVAVILVAAFLASLGPNLVLHAPPPGVRVLMGFQVPLAIALLLLSALSRPAFAAGACLLLFWNFSFCCRYAHFLTVQARAADMVLTRLVGDLDRLRAQRGVAWFAVVDAIPPSPVERTILSRAPAIGIVALGQDMRWFTAIRIAALTDGVAFGDACAIADTVAHHAGPVFTEEDGDYTIRVSGPDAVVDFDTRARTADACP